jgi:hypothetical protein
MAPGIAAAFQRLREDWSELSTDYARLLTQPYDRAAFAAHLERLRLHRARLRFLRESAASGADNRSAGRDADTM